MLLELTDALPSFLAAAEIVWVVAALLLLVWERRSPTATLAWGLTLALLPLVGLPLYFLLGPRRLQRRCKRLHRARERLAAARQAWAGSHAVDLTQDEQLMRTLTQLTGLPPERARSVTLLPDGDRALDAIVAAVDAARDHVHVEYYIFRPDQAGTRLRDALTRAAARGVEVRLLVDASGSSSLGDAFVAPLVEAGGRFARFNPVLRTRLARHDRVLRSPLVPTRLPACFGNFRTHRKIVVVDALTGFTGGINVTDEERASVRGPEAWRDTQLRVEGAAAHGLQAVFLENWLYALPDDELPEGEALVARFLAPDAGGEVPVQIVGSGPDQPHSAMAALFLAALAGARERVWITVPYLVPDEPLLAALRGAALRGVDVQVIIPVRSDSALVDGAGRTFHEALRDAKVKLHCYGPPMIHAKTWVVDRSLGIVGSPNLDSRSLRLNFEVTAVVYGGALADELAALFQQDLQRTRPAGSDARLPVARRLFDSMARLLAPQL